MTSELPLGDKLLLRVPEAALLLSVSESEIYRLMAAGRLKSVLLGSRRRIPRAALEAFVAELTAEAQQWDERYRLQLRRVRA